MRKLLFFTSLLEFTLGIVLLIFPSVVFNLIFGINNTESITVLGRFTGIVFICFGLACFPSKSIEIVSSLPTFKAMFTYNLLATIYFTYIKIVTGFNGILLVPAVILHGLITAYFIFLMWKKGNK
jgi:hypothetical protein